MTNFEKYKKWFEEHEIEFKYCARAFGVNEDGKVEFCHGLACADCIFKEGYCPDNRAKWLKAEAEEEKVDWSKVEVDTLVEVQLRDGEWIKRYFAAYIGGRVHVWDCGKSDKSNTTTGFKHARLCVHES